MVRDIQCVSQKPKETDMLTLALKLIRSRIGGKSEVSLMLVILGVVIYALPIFPALTWEVLKAYELVVVSVFGASILGRIENKEGVINAVKSLFAALRKK